MGICNSRKDEIFTGRRPIPIKMANKVLESICEIAAKHNQSTTYGTGFFMNLNSKIYLITNHHVISKDIIYDDIKIKMDKNKSMIFKLENREIKYYPEPKDITIVEIKKNDEIYKYIKCLDYDNNYVKNGYLIYKNADVFSVMHPFNKDPECSSGKITNIDNFEFSYDISTDSGSSGSPIILLNNNQNIIQVIGIHKLGDNEEKLNFGTFIGEIINNNFANTNNELKENLSSNIKINETEQFPDLNIGVNTMIPLEIVVKAMKSICKVTKLSNDSPIGISYVETGFFMNINSLKYLISNSNLLSQKFEKGIIKIEIHNHKTMILNLENRHINICPKHENIAIIEIKNDDIIYKDIEFLDYDNKYIDKGYYIYKDAEVFSIQHPRGKNASFANGKIIDIINDFEFYHSIETGQGSGGSPIILIDHINIHKIKVIGIHYGRDTENGYGYGTFIGEIFKK